MAFEHKINKGSVFPADTKDSPTSRDYQGSMRVECPCCQAFADFWVSGWVNETKGGVKYLGLAVNPKDEQPSQNVTKGVDLFDDNNAPPGLEKARAAMAARQQGVPEDDLGKDIPF